MMRSAPFLVSLLMQLVFAQPATSQDLTRGASVDRFRMTQTLRQDTDIPPAQGVCNTMAGCTSKSCIEGAQEVGPDGLPVCGDGTQCRVLAQGCEICPAPILTVKYAGMQELVSGDFDLPGFEPTMTLYSFEESATVTISREQTSVCTLLCWTYSEIKQSGLSKMDDQLPRYPVLCGEGEPCGNSQNPCIDLSRQGSIFDTPLFVESTLIRARLFNLDERTSSSDIAMYLVNKQDLVKNVRCGDGFTVNREYGTSDEDVEACDDGNKLQFDGCDQHCGIEPGFTCLPNTTNPFISNCTGADLPVPFGTDMFEVFINFGTPLIGAFVLLCCCLCIRRFNPDILKVMLPFGVHEKLAVVGLGLEEEDTKHKHKEKAKTAQQIKQDVEDQNQVSKYMEKALHKRADFRQWQLRLSVVEAQFLPVCDVAIRDKQLVGLADPYVTGLCVCVCV